MGDGDRRPGVVKPEPFRGQSRRARGRGEGKADTVPGAKPDCDFGNIVLLVCDKHLWFLEGGVPRMFARLVMFHRERVRRFF